MGRDAGYESTAGVWRLRCPVGRCAEPHHRQRRAVAAAPGDLVARRAATDPRFTPMERHAAGAVPSATLQCQRPIYLAAESDNPNFVPCASEGSSEFPAE